LIARARKLNCASAGSAYIYRERRQRLHLSGSAYIYYGKKRARDAGQGKIMVRRRDILLGGAAVAALAAAGVGLKWRSGAKAATETFEVMKTPEEWRKLLTPEQYSVLREADTERAFTSPLNKEKRQGTFVCAGCDLPLFGSETKFDSGTGWPSFYAPIENAVKQDTDFTFGMVREEVHCRRCGGHLGHVFDDGPNPTGLRYCINGLALKFVAA
jgi:peptide-methionine (R)-S-oxide reductase